ncbi:hypothetical protein [Treponema zioleckii]|uniref:hypothetical protein n=1 Tax=Treponema zioleckii TaxID=331680 RepID=UPI00168B4209|nr:hypothetical protein [Treponema zioleckii]
MKNKRFLFIFLIPNIMMFLIFLSAFWIIRIFDIVGMLFSVACLFMWGLLNAVLIIVHTVKKRNLKYLFFAIIPVFNWCLMLLFSKYAVPERFDLFFSFPTIQKELSNHLSDKEDNENVRVFGKYVGIIWEKEFLDDYSVVVFDEDDNFLELYKAKDNELLRTFGYDIRDVLKIKKYYYRVRIES